MIPIGTDRPQRRVPWVNLALIAVNVVVFLASHGGGGGAAAGLGPWWRQFMLYGQPVEYGGGAGTVVPAWYQLLTYQFLHADIYHILGNMVFLYVFGNGLNEKLGHLAYLLFYLTGGVLAGCGQLLTSAGPTLGASGSISAVTGMFFVLLPRTNVKLFIMLFFFIDVLEIPSLWFLLFSVAKDVVEPYMFPRSNVAHWAHVSGNVAGFAVGLMVLGLRLVQRDHYDLLAMVERWRRRRQYESLVAGGYDPFSPTRGVRAEAAAVVDPRVAGLRAAVGELLRQHDLPGAVGKYLELKGVDPRQVLAPQEQLDVANQLMAEGRYEAAAEAYEDYLRTYPRAAQNEQVELILGVIYARYVTRPARAVELLKKALVRLQDAAQRTLAEDELNRLTEGGGGPARAGGSGGGGASAGPGGRAEGGGRAG